MFPIKQNISLKNKTNQTNKLQFKKIPWEKAQVGSLEISGRNFPPLTSWALCLPFWLPPDLKFPFKAINTVENWKEKKIYSELMEVGGGRDHIPMNLLLHVSKKRELSVPFTLAQTVPHVSITEGQPNNQPSEIIQTTEAAMVW